MLLTEADLNMIRGDQSLILPDLADVSRPVQTNGALGQTVVYEPYKQLRCRIAPVGDRRSESVVQDMLWKDVQTESFLHVATFPMNSYIEINDRAIVRGRQYDVVAKLTDSSFVTAERVMVKEVR